METIRKYWFLMGLLAVFGISIGDMSGTTALAGRWLRAHHGPDTVIFVIFLLSGMLLDAKRILSGFTDISGTLAALGLIFVAGPLLAVLPGMTEMDTGIRIGIFLVAVMPTTLSSGVVMTGAAGGNMAHALVITIAANALSVFTIPLSLSLLLKLVGDTAAVSIDRTAIMLKLAGLVLLPLCMGLGVRHCRGNGLAQMESRMQFFNQFLILLIVWMAVSQTRDAIIGGADKIVILCVLAFVFHAVLLLFAGLIIRIFRMEPGRRESLLFMGCQKTLTLSVILQVSLFPRYGTALVFCVLHHIIHLLMDAWLVGRWQRKSHEGKISV